MVSTVKLRLVVKSKMHVGIFTLFYLIIENNVRKDIVLQYAHLFLGY